MGIVETELAQGIASPGRDDAARHLDNARLEIGLIRQLVPPSDLQSLTARLNGLEAEVLARLAGVRRDPALLDRAERLLSDSLNVTPGANLVGAAWLEYRRGLVASARWVASGEGAQQDVARQHFEAAQTLLSPGQDLRFARKLREGYEAAGLAVPEELAKPRLTVILRPAPRVDQDPGGGLSSASADSRSIQLRIQARANFHCSRTQRSE